MTTTVRDFSISARTTTSYQRALANLREALKRHGFEILFELMLDRELDRKVGLRWQHYTVFVVWSPFDAYQAVLSDRDGGLLVPFNLCVAEDGNSTFVAVSNHTSLSRSAGPIGIQVLVRDLARKIRQVLVEVAMQEEPLAYREVRSSEARGF
jgi:uncharacterized protein (DUF302 family)